MMRLNRRNFLLSTAVAGSLLFSVCAAYAADTATILATPSSLGDMTMGAEDAKIVFIEYASASCSHCAEFAKTVFPILKKDYIDTGKIRFVYREFPHDDPGLAGFMLARCAPKDKYFGFIDALYATQSTWLRNPRDGLFNIAQQAGLSKTEFEECLKNKNIAAAILDVKSKAESIGIDAIPVIFINGIKFTEMPTIEALRAKIDPLL